MKLIYALQDLIDLASLFDSITLSPNRGYAEALGRWLITGHGNIAHDEGNSSSTRSHFRYFLHVQPPPPPGSAIQVKSKGKTSCVKHEPVEFTDGGTANLTELEGEDYSVHYSHPYLLFFLFTKKLQGQIDDQREQNKLSLNARRKAPEEALPCCYRDTHDLRSARRLAQPCVYGKVTHLEAGDDDSSELALAFQSSAEPIILHSDDELFEAIQIPSSPWFSIGVTGRDRDRWIGTCLRVKSSREKFYFVRSDSGQVQANIPLNLLLADDSRIEPSRISIEGNF